MAGELQSTVDAEGIRHSEMQVIYRTDQPELARVSQALDAEARQSGNHVLEHGSDRAERRRLPVPASPAEKLRRSWSDKVERCPPQAALSVAAGHAYPARAG